MGAAVIAFLIEFKDTVNVVLGCALGFASALGFEWWKNRKDARDVRRAISQEFREVALRLAAATYRLESSHGCLNRVLLEWTYSQFQRYGARDPRNGVLANIERLLHLSDDEIEKAARQQATMRPQHWPPEEPSYTMSSVGKLHDLGQDYARGVLEVLSHIRMFNDARETALFYLRLSFTPCLSADNYDKAEENRKTGEAQAANRARIIIDRIGALEERYPQDP